MIDIHCHMLPMFDDGARTIDKALIMAKTAVENGITKTVVTPHHKNGMYDNEKRKVEAGVFTLQAMLDKNNIPLELIPGQEVRINGDILSEIDQGKITFIGKSSNYLLLEFPPMFIPTYSEYLFVKLKERGIIPIIAHPERNQVFINNPNRLIQFINEGALGQLTAHSYLGIRGKKIKKISRQFVAEGLVHIIATDAHNEKKNNFCLGEVYTGIKDEFGLDKKLRFEHNAQAVVAGDRVNR
ncbi:tyrosine-protein phosphatase [Enterococcus rivorum]|uniref:Tyrosine-protein phosphatase n=1 Tax=Enterococcus rivorum TaxID=762845 RepID=A0A1E5KSA9_9ENTE|nr:CpsB/CapC family capsule biosynthesis tyrosine phosphatase [Enterococcus rivorum]MBP2097439.1 protein-tyrosine phosphatase [Enterococcus rivorum]OEH80782.1 hypothetical protein BCR26_07210 [Enterococcus rivorum]